MAKRGETKVDWVAVRERWETDPRQGYKWLIDEMGLDVISNTVGQRKRKEKWVKRVEAHNVNGAPTKYREEYVDQARRLCLLGAHNEELADFFSISTHTLNQWMHKHEDFSLAIKEGRQVADSKVAERLYERALGYSHPDTDIKVIDGEIVTTEIVKHYPPDTAAAFIWLKNRRPTQWRDKVEIDSKPTIALVDKEALNEIYQRELARAEQERQRMLERSGRFQLLEHDELT